MSDTRAEQRRCRAFKHGRVDLTCALDEGHDGWHEALFTDHQEVAYLGARHIVDLAERVTWETVDHVAESVHHLMKAISDKPPAGLRSNR